MGSFLFFVWLFCKPLHSTVGCLSVLVWTHAVLGVLYSCILYFGICIVHLFSTVEHVSHGRRSRNAIIVIMQCVPTGNDSSNFEFLLVPNWTEQHNQHIQTESRVLLL